MPATLLQGGTVLVHDLDDHITPIQADLLIEGNKIVKLGKDIEATAAKIINCRGEIVSPGFIDTHRHMWQTQLKGRHANQLLLEYIPTGNLVASLFTPLDIFWGELGGAMESIDAGTTTVVDHAHVNYSI
jgi:cytosine/adenosine deaminase-related metal-dependent hydrolase